MSLRHGGGTKTEPFRRQRCRCGHLRDNHPSGHCYICPCEAYEDERPAPVIPEPVYAGPTARKRRQLGAGPAW